MGTASIEKYLRTLEEMGYGIERMIEQERDMPLRWQFLKIERPTMKELMNDPRVWEDPRALTVLFSKRLPETGLMFEIASEQRLKASAFRTL